jgi:hypothetical protein
MCVHRIYNSGNERKALEMTSLRTNKKGLTHTDRSNIRFGIIFHFSCSERLTGEGFVCATD